MGFSEEVSYGVLALVSIFCIFQVSFQKHPLNLLAYAATGVTAFCALFAIHFSSTDVENIRSWSEFFESFTFPCLVGYLWVVYGEEFYIAYAFPVIMVLLKLIGSDVLGYDPSTMMAIGYAISQVACIYLAIVKQNLYAIIATVLFSLTELVLVFKQDLPLPPTESVNYGLSAVILLFSFAYKCAEM